MHQNTHLSHIPFPNRVIAGFATNGRRIKVFLAMLPGSTCVCTSHRDVMSEVVFLHHVKCLFF